MRLRLIQIVVLTAAMLGGSRSATAARAQSFDFGRGDTSRTYPPLTGRAIACAGGKIEGFDCQNVELLAYLPPSALGGAGEYDIWGWTDSATGREFALIGGATSTAFVEVTDPVNPRHLGNLRFHDGASGKGQVKVYKNHAFIVVDRTARAAGMQVFDLTQLRTVRTPPVAFEETAHYAHFHNAHTITMNVESGFAFPTGITVGGETCGTGLHMIDVRTPTTPTFAGCYVNKQAGLPGWIGYVHDAMCLNYRGPDRQYTGREICLNSVNTAVDIVDVTDKQQPKTISTVTYPNVRSAHQGWFTEDQRYFFLDDEYDDGAGGIDKTRTIVFDMNDLDDPTVLTEFHGTTSATDHNLYIRGKYMYQSNYTAGLRIVDVSDPKHPKEVGYLDTAPDLDGPGMKLGSWGNYPFFKNDVVAVTSRGLFLVRLKAR